MSTKRIAEAPGPSRGRRSPVGLPAGLLFPALSVALLLAACGGDNEETTATPGGTLVATATQTTSDTPAAGVTQTPAGEATQTATATAQGSAGEIDPCALVTKAEAEAIVGEPLDGPAVTRTEMASSCLYSTPDLKGVNVGVLTYQNEDDAESAFWLAIDINNFPEVGGIGDRAYDSRPIGDITVLKGKYEVSVDVNVEGDEGQGADVEGDDVEWTGIDFEAARELAAKAVDRLP